jgi:hypothetical protein
MTATILVGIIDLRNKLNGEDDSPRLILYLRARMESSITLFQKQAISSNPLWKYLALTFNQV